MATKIASLYAEIGADVSKFVSGLGQAKAATKEYAKEAEKLTREGADFRKIIPGIDDYIGRLKAATPENAKMAMGLAEIDKKFKAGNITSKQAVDQLEKLKSQYTTGESALHRFGGKLNDVVQGLTGFNLATLASVGGVIALGKGIMDTMSSYSSYVEAVDKMSMSTGMASEQTSRLIQLADDFRVDQGSLTTAMKMALQNGFNPTVENLAKLSDRYKSIQDPTQRAAEMQKIFGRQWQDMVPLLNAGGAAIEEAYKGISDGLVVTQAAINSNREMIKSLDDLGDAWTAAKYSVVAAVGPEVSGKLKIFAQNISDLSNGVSIFKILGDNQKAYAELTKRLADEKARAEDAAIRKNEQAIRGQLKGNDEVIASTKELTEEEQKHYDQISQKSQVYNERASKYRASIDQQVEDSKRLQAALKETYSDIKTIVGGAFGEEDQKFKEKSDQIRKEIDKTKAKIAELVAQPYSSPEQQQQIDDQINKLGDLQIELDDTVKAHETAMKTMAFNMLIERAASDGLTENEVNNMATIAVAWGLWDTKTAEVVGAVNKNMGSLDTKNPQQILDILNAIMGLPNEKNIRVNTEYTETGQRGGKHGGEVFANGGSFVIPPGYPNDSYYLGGNHWGQSGETVTVTPAGQTPAPSVQYILNATYSGQGESNAMSDFRMLELLHR